MRRLRRALWPVSLAYGGVMAARNALFDSGLRRPARLPVRIVSVGNLTVGGTGKTPLVTWLVEAAMRAGLRPGVLARGYGRPAGAELNDEGAMLRGRFPELLQVQEPDRIAGARRLLEMGAEVVILDDAFQHRRLARDRDLVCLDASQPFADRLLLPAGDLREGPGALRRADGVVLTRAEGCDEAALVARRERVRSAARRPDLPVWIAHHRVRDVVWSPEGAAAPISSLAGARVCLVCAVARPGEFERTVRSAGIEVVRRVFRRDHHRYDPGELRRIAARAREEGVAVLVTEKDAPKLSGWEHPHGVVRIDVVFPAGAPEPSWLWGGRPVDTGPASR